MKKKYPVCGKRLVRWRDYKECVSVDGPGLAELKAGDYMVIICRVLDTKTGFDKEGKPYSRVNYEIEETRKLNGFV